MAKGNVSIYAKSMARAAELGVYPKITAYFATQEPLSTRELPKPITSKCHYCGRGLKAEWDECKSCGAPNHIYSEDD